MSLIKTFEPNELGRDFVVGDLHGSVELLELILLHLNFNPMKDRMFSVGDLIDRGPESLRTLKLIEEDWFHCVLANHEMMMVEAFDGGYMGQFWIQNGGEWGLQAYRDITYEQPIILSETHRPPPPEQASIDLWNLLPKVKELPVLITVNQKNEKRIHLIHAELPPGYGGELTDADLESEEIVRELMTRQSEDGDFILWGRHLYYNFYRADLSNLDKIRRTVGYHHASKAFNPALSHIVSGHTIVQKPLTIYGQTNIDTCAYGSFHTQAPNWCALTCLNLDTWEFIQATKDGIRTVEPVVINSAEEPEVQK